MIIVSQNKEMIVNFNRVESIDIVADLDGTGEVPYRLYYETESTREELGKYKNEERAKEVLQEITDLYKKCEYEKGQYYYKAYGIPKVYEMPED